MLTAMRVMFLVLAACGGKPAEPVLTIETLENLVFQFKAQKFDELPSNMTGTTTDVRTSSSRIAAKRFTTATRSC